MGVLVLVAVKVIVGSTVHVTVAAGGIVVDVAVSVNSIVVPLSPGLGEIVAIARGGRLPAIAATVCATAVSFTLGAATFVTPGKVQARIARIMTTNTGRIFLVIAHSFLFA
jgi:hypothetical protein